MTEAVQDAINNIDFQDDQQVNNLTDFLESYTVPHVTAGIFKDYEYCFAPSAYTLFGDETSTRPLADGNHLLPTSFLALDLNDEYLNCNKSRIWRTHSALVDHLLIWLDRLSQTPVIRMASRTDWHISTGAA